MILITVVMVVMEVMVTIMAIVVMVVVEEFAVCTRTMDGSIDSESTQEDLTYENLLERPKIYF